MTYHTELQLFKRLCLYSHPLQVEKKFFAFVLLIWKSARLTPLESDGTSNAHQMSNEFTSVSITCKSIRCVSTWCSSNAHLFNPHQEADWKWIQSESRMKCMGEDGSHVIQFLPIPHPTPWGANEEQGRRKYSGQSGQGLSEQYFHLGEGVALMGAVLSYCACVFLG